MRYVAIDIETTGLDPATCQILELAAVVETDWVTPVEQLPRLRLLVSHDVYRGEAFALAMHAGLLRDLAARKGNAMEPDLLIHLDDFIEKHFPATEAPTVAGKNFAAFDLRFIERLPHYRRRMFKHRVIDPGSMWAEPTDDKVPDTAECMRRAGVTNDHPHSALHDCYAVIEMVRAKFRKTQPDAVRAGA